MPFLPQNKVTDKISSGSIIEYELHGTVILAVAKQEKGSKWQLLNQEGASVELPPSRFFLYSDSYQGDFASDKVADFLKKYLLESLELTELFDEKLAWEELKDVGKEFTLKEIADAGVGDTAPRTLLAVRRVLLRDAIYFKRKNWSFLPRTSQAVQEMQKQVEVIRKREAAISELERWLEKPEGTPPEMVSELERVALGNPHTREIANFLDSLSGGKRAEEKARKLLFDSGVWQENLDINLAKIGLHKGFDKQVIEEALSVSSSSRGSEEFSCVSLTIDGEESTDLDDALSYKKVERGHQVGIHISDASFFVPVGSRLDSEALKRGTSIYCPDYSVSMLPKEISSGSASLLAGDKRGVLSFFVTVSDDGTVVDSEIKLSSICVTHRLSYSSADKILYDEEGHECAEVLKALWKVSTARETKRLLDGADSFLRTNVYPSIDKQGRISLVPPEDTASGSVVTEAMIMANEAAANYARDRGLALLFRTQDAPEGDVEAACSDLPEGPAADFKRRSFLKRSVVGIKAGPHYGLGISTYAQVTSPIRRYVDLLNHRQLISSVTQEATPLSGEEVMDCYKLLEPKLDAARSIQRDRENYWIQRYLIQENVKKLSATVVRVDGAKPLALLDLLGFCYPFKTKASRKPELGEEIELEVTKLDPMNLVYFE